MHISARIVLIERGQATDDGVKLSAPLHHDSDAMCVRGEVASCATDNAFIGVLVH